MASSVLMNSYISLNAFQQQQQNGHELPPCSCDVRTAAAGEHMNFQSRKSEYHVQLSLWRILRRQGVLLRMVVKRCKHLHFDLYSPIKM